jgi:hypothetical protein
MNRTPIASPLLLVGRDATETWHGSDDEYREVGLSPAMQRSLLGRFNDMGEIGPHFKCIVDNPIVHRVVHCEALLSGVRRRLDAVNVHQFVTVTSSRSLAVRISPFAFCTSSLRTGFRVRLSRT